MEVTQLPSCSELFGGNSKDKGEKCSIGDDEIRKASKVLRSVDPHCQLDVGKERQAHKSHLREGTLYQ